LTIKTGIKDIEISHGKDSQAGSGTFEKLPPAFHSLACRRHRSP
jgi:hypothetical protein